MAKKKQASINWLKELRRMKSALGAVRAGMALEFTGVSGAAFKEFERQAKAYALIVRVDPLPIGWVAVATMMKGRAGVTITVTTSEEYING